MTSIKDVEQQRNEKLPNYQNDQTTVKQYVDRHKNNSRQSLNNQPESTSVLNDLSQVHSSNIPKFNDKQNQDYSDLIHTRVPKTKFQTSEQNNRFTSDQDVLTSNNKSRQGYSDVSKYDNQLNEDYSDLNGKKHKPTQDYSDLICNQLLNGKKHKCQSISKYQLNTAKLNQIQIVNLNRLRTTSINILKANFSQNVRLTHQQQYTQVTLSTIDKIVQTILNDQITIILPICSIVDLADIKLSACCQAIVGDNIITTDNIFKTSSYVVLIVLQLLTFTDSLRIQSFIILLLKYGNEINVYILSHLLSRKKLSFFKFSNDLMNQITETLYHTIFEGSISRPNNFDNIARHILQISGFINKVNDHRYCLDCVNDRCRYTNEYLNSNQLGPNRCDQSRRIKFQQRDVQVQGNKIPSNFLFLFQSKCFCRNINQNDNNFNRKRNQSEDQEDQNNTNSYKRRNQSDDENQTKVNRRVNRYFVRQRSFRRNIGNKRVELSFRQIKGGNNLINKMNTQKNLNDYLSKIKGGLDQIKKTNNPSDQTHFQFILGSDSLLQLTSLSKETSYQSLIIMDNYQNQGPQLQNINWNKYDQKKLQQQIIGLVNPDGIELPDNLTIKTMNNDHQISQITQDDRVQIQNHFLLPFRSQSNEKFWYCFDNESSDYIKYVNNKQMTNNNYFYSQTDKSDDNAIISFLKNNIFNTNSKRESCVAVSNFAHNLYEMCYLDVMSITQTEINAKFAYQDVQKQGFCIKVQTLINWIRQTYELYFEGQLVSKPNIIEIDNLTNTDMIIFVSWNQNKYQYENTLMFFVYSFIEIFDEYIYSKTKIKSSLSNFYHTIRLPLNTLGRIVALCLDDTSAHMISFQTYDKNMQYYPKMTINQRSILKESYLRPNQRKSELQSELDDMESSNSIDFSVQSQDFASQNPLITEDTTISFLKNTDITDVILGLQFNNDEKNIIFQQIKSVFQNNETHLSWYQQTSSEPIGFESQDLIQPLLNKIVNHRNILTALNDNINDIRYQKSINTSNGGIYYRNLMQFDLENCYYDLIDSNNQYDEIVFTYYPNRLSDTKTTTRHKTVHKLSKKYLIHKVSQSSDIFDRFFFNVTVSKTHLSQEQTLKTNMIRIFDFITTQIQRNILVDIYEIVDYSNNQHRTHTDSVFRQIHSSAQFLFDNGVQVGLLNYCDFNYAWKFNLVSMQGLEQFFETADSLKHLHRAVHYNIVQQSAVSRTTLTGAQFYRFIHLMTQNFNSITNELNYKTNVSEFQRKSLSDCISQMSKLGVTEENIFSNTNIMYDNFIQIFSINYDKNILTNIGLGDMHMDVITQMERVFIHIFCTQLIRAIQDGYTVLGSLAKQLITQLSDQTLNIFMQLVTQEHRTNDHGFMMNYMNIRNGSILQTAYLKQTEVLKNTSTLHNINEDELEPEDDEYIFDPMIWLPVILAAIFVMLTYLWSNKKSPLLKENMFAAIVIPCVWIMLVKLARYSKYVLEYFSKRTMTPFHPKPLEISEFHHKLDIDSYNDLLNCTYQNKKLIKYFSYRNNVRRDVQSVIRSKLRQHYSLYKDGIVDESTAKTIDYYISYISKQCIGLTNKQQFTVSIENGFIQILRHTEQNYINFQPIVQKHSKPKSLFFKNDESRQINGLVINRNVSDKFTFEFYEQEMCQRRTDTINSLCYQQQIKAMIKFNQTDTLSNIVDIYTSMLTQQGMVKYEDLLLFCYKYDKIQGCQSDDEKYYLLAINLVMNFLTNGYMNNIKNANFQIPENIEYINNEKQKYCISTKNMSISLYRCVSAYLTTTLLSNMNNKYATYFYQKMVNSIKQHDLLLNQNFNTDVVYQLQSHQNSLALKDIVQYQNGFMYILTTCYEIKKFHIETEPWTILKDSVLLVDTEFRSKNNNVINKSVYSIQIIEFDVTSCTIIKIGLFENLKHFYQSEQYSQILINKFHKMITKNRYPSMYFWDSRKDIEQLDIQQLGDYIKDLQMIYSNYHTFNQFTKTDNQQVTRIALSTAFNQVICAKTPKFKSYTDQPAYEELAEYGVGDVLQMAHIYKFMQTSMSYKISNAIAFSLQVIAVDQSLQENILKDMAQITLNSELHQHDISFCNQGPRHVVSYADPFSTVPKKFQITHCSVMNKGGITQVYCLYIAMIQSLICHSKNIKYCINNQGNLELFELVFWKPDDLKKLKKLFFINGEPCLNSLSEYDVYFCLPYVIDGRTGDKLYKNIRFRELFKDKFLLNRLIIKQVDVPTNLSQLIKCMNDLGLFIQIHSDANPDQLTIHNFRQTSNVNHIPFIYHFAVNQHFSQYFYFIDNQGNVKQSEKQVYNQPFLHATAIVDTKIAQKLNLPYHKLTEPFKTECNGCIRHRNVINKHMDKLQAYNQQMYFTDISMRNHYNDSSIGNVESLNISIGQLESGQRQIYDKVDIIQDIYRERDQKMQLTNEQLQVRKQHGYEQLSHIDKRIVTKKYKKKGVLIEYNEQYPSIAKIQKCYSRAQMLIPSKQKKWNIKQKKNFNKFKSKLQQQVSNNDEWLKISTPYSIIGPQITIQIDSRNENRVRLLEKYGFQLIQDGKNLDVKHATIMNGMANDFNQQVNSANIRAAKESNFVNPYVQKDFVKFCRIELNNIICQSFPKIINNDIIDQAINHTKKSNKKSKDKKRIINNLYNFYDDDKKTRTKYKPHMKQTEAQYSFFNKREAQKNQLVTNRLVQPLEETIRTLGIAEFETISVICEMFIWSHFVKHMNQGQINTKLNQVLKKAKHTLILDFSKFDSTVNEIYLSIENDFIDSLYKNLTINQFSYKQTNSMQSVSNGQYFTLVSPQSRKSGVLMTALGNTIINVLVMKYVFNKNGFTESINYDFLAEGDDFIGFFQHLDDELLDNIQKTFQQIGFQTTGGYHPSDYDQFIEHDHFEFCGNLIKNDEQGPIMVPQVSKMLRKIMIVSDNTHIPQYVHNDGNKYIHPQAIEYNMLKVISLLSRYSFPEEGLSDTLDHLLNYTRLNKQHMLASHYRVYIKIVKIYTKLLTKAKIYNSDQTMNGVTNQHVQQIIDHNWNIGDEIAKLLINNPYKVGCGVYQQDDYACRIRKFYNKQDKDLISTRNLVQSYLKSLFDHDIVWKIDNQQLNKLTNIDDKIFLNDNKIVQNLLGEYKKMTDDKNKLTTQINLSTSIKGTGNNKRIGDSNSITQIRGFENNDQSIDYQQHITLQQPKMQSRLHNFTQQLNQARNYEGQGVEQTTLTQNPVWANLKYTPRTYRITIGPTDISLEHSEEKGFLSQSEFDISSFTKLYKHLIGSKSFIFIEIINENDINQVQPFLGDCAILGIVFHINTNLYSNMKQQLGIFQARQKIKIINSHNEKMGFDWSVRNKQWIANDYESQQFGNQSQTSGYKQLLLNTYDSVYLNKRFSMPLDQIMNLQRQQKQQQPIRNVQITDMETFGLHNEDPKVQYNKQSVLEIAKDLSKDHRQQMEVFDKMVQKIDLTDDNERYLRSMSQPFQHSARIPELIPSYSVLLQDQQDFTFTVPGNNTTSMLVMDFKASGVPSMAIYKDIPTAVLASVQSQLLQIPKNDGTDNNNVLGQAYLSGGGIRYDNLKNETEVSEVVGFQQVASTVRLVSGGFRLYKTSMAESESGRIRMFYNRNQNNITTSIDNMLDSAAGQNNYYEQSLVGKMDAVEGLYKPFNNDDAVRYQDARSPTLTHGFQNFPGGGNVFNDIAANSLDTLTLESDGTQYVSGSNEFRKQTAYYRSFRGPLSFVRKTIVNQNQVERTIYQYADPETLNSDICYIDLKSMFRPHTVIILFEEVATSSNSMSFTCKLCRHFEGIPTGSGKFLERNTAQLSKYSLPLEILRDASIQQDILTELTSLKRQLEPHHQIYLDEVIRVFGFWDSPFFKNVSHKLKDLAQKISHSDIFKSVLPIISKAVATRYKVPPEVIDQVTNMITQ